MTEPTRELTPLKPSPSLLCKLASVVVHCDELLSPLGQGVDKEALAQATRDPEVQEWAAAMTKLAMAPVKRTMEDLKLQARRKP